MNRKKEQIQERREFGKEYLYRRGRADSVIRLGSNLFVGEAFSACVSSSHVSYFIGTSELKRLCFYKKSSGYFYFFPASGYRNYDDGTLRVSGTWGYGWTSTPYNSSNAWNLNFNSGNANMNNNNRGNGFPVRCVQASAPVFVFTKNTFCFFPAAGVRRASDGVLYYSGVEGDGWTSTPGESGCAYRFILNSGTAYMGSEANRTFGFPVRCVQASAAVFAFTKDTFCFFPATGYREFSDGRYSYPGSWGLVWASTPSGGNAWSFTISSGRPYMNANNRGNGFPVRCVQASAAVFAFTKDTLAFFPAAGLRNYSDGSLGSSGTQALVWSSVPSGESAYRLYSSPTGVFVTSVTRMYGFPVRCVQASASVWVLQKENIKQIRYRRESGKARLCRRGRADSVTHLGHKLSANEMSFVCAVPSYSISFIKLPDLKRLYFYKHSSGYFLFFPASGVRSFDAGILYNGGVEGDAWTSSPAVEDGAWYLYFSSGSLWVSVVSRCYGFPVRCVQASATIFVSVSEAIEEIVAFFPASGHRNYSDGKLTASGASGYGWSSTPNGSSNGWYLDIWPTVARMYSNFRTYGFAVRCVQASAAVFAFTKDTFCFFPAAGIREYTDGQLYNSGTEGDGWTSVPNGNNAFRLIFKSGYAYVTSVSRMYGFPVRCVQASAAVGIASIKNTEQVRYRRESGKGILCRRGRADSVTRLGRKLSAGRSLSLCVASSHVLMLIRILLLTEFCFYKYSSGYFFFFPASGNRNNSDGKLYNSGSNGYGWTSTPYNSSNAYTLYFNSGDAYLNNNNRANGRSVRCVQASATLFASGRKANERINAGERIMCF